MVWNPKDCPEGSEESIVLFNQPCPLLTAPADLDSLPSGQSETDSFLPSEVITVSSYPDSFSCPSTNENLMSSSEQSNALVSGVILSSQFPVDNLIYQEKNVWPMANETTPVLDNDINFKMTIDNGTHESYYEVNEEVSTRKSRIRQDSTDSLDTVDSSSSGEIFNSNYTDTISSVDSTDFLLKSSADSDNELPIVDQSVQECYYNIDYMSCSSTEMLNETESDNEIIKNEPSMENSKETDTLLGLGVEGDVTETQEEAEEKLIDLNGMEAKALDEFVPHPLVPIQENQVVSFNLKDGHPTEYVKITNNVISVDESFLFQSTSSLWDTETGKNGLRACTMQNLHEKSSFLDLTEASKIGKACQKALIYLKDDINFGSLASLNNITNKQIEKDPVQSLSLISGEKGMDVVKSNKHMKNLLALSFCLTLLYIAIGSVRNLQSSINHEGGVGVLSMATNSIGYTLGSLFSASIVLNFQPRKCIIVNLIPNLLYVAANIYPSIWLMIPVSFIQGISMAIIWNAVSTYVIFLSRGRTQATGEASDQVSSKFFGILCLMYQSHLIIGNLIASLVLMPGGSGNSTSETTPHIANLTDLQASSFFVQDLNRSNPSVESHSSIGMEGIISNASSITASHLSLCGAKFCHHFDMGGSGFAVSNETKYLLFGIYMGCIVLSLLIAVLMMEPLNQRLFTSSVKPLQKFKSQFSSMLSFFGDVKFLLLLPLLMYSVIQFGFITAEFTKAFVTCSLGIHMVGYTMICFGICGGLSSYLSGLLTKFTGRIPLFIFAGANNLALLIFMKQWQPNPDSLMPFFIIMGIWGISDGIWISQVNSLMGIIFPLKYEEAYAGLRIAQGIGPAIAFGYSASLCMEVKIYISVTLCIVSVIFYLLMEGLLRRKTSQEIIKFKQTTV